MIDGNDKENLTQICTVAAAGAKLPMGMSANGETGACERRFGDIGEHCSDHSKIG
jgi:hypothetical protein